jgi:hypothetical protein
VWHGHLSGSEEFPYRKQRNSRLSSRRQTIASSAQLWFGDKARGAFGGSNGAALAKRLWVAAAFAGSMPASRIALSRSAGGGATSGA